MATYFHEASLEAPITPAFQKLIVESEAAVAIPEAKSTKPLTSSQQEKAEAQAQINSEWVEPLILARWVVDLGPLNLHSDSDDCGSSGHAKRPAAQAEDSQPAKRRRLSNGRSINSHGAGFRVQSFKYLQRIHVTPLQGRGIATSQRGIWERDKRAITALAFENKSGTTSDELQIHFDASEDERARLYDLFQLERSPNRLDRAVSTIQLGVDDTDGTERIKLILELHWKDCRDLNETLRAAPITSSVQAIERLLLHLYPTLAVKEPDSGFSPHVFYNSVHVPEYDARDVKKEMDVPGLHTGLYPFQKRSIRWLLEREKASPAAQETLSHGFIPFLDVNGARCYFSPWLQLFTRDKKLACSSMADVKGGILAEEMGLGKTVEMISLIQLHKRDEHDMGLRDEIHRSGTTLVIAPSAIVAQWESEIATHCPGLSVLNYQGLPSTSSAKKRLSDDDLIEYLICHDVVLVDYNILRKEIWAATDPPDRTRRKERVYERRKSVLTRIDWWRVVLDEAQMIESGQPQAGQVASMLPRQNAWAVSGTPLRKDSGDLLALLKFLGLDDITLAPGLWKRLLSNYTPIFKELVKRICLRHSKDQVTGDLQLPPQRRIVINVPFTAIEEQNYNQLFEEMTSACDLNMDGSPFDGTWNPDDPFTISAMRDWLAKLRKICLHPDVGGKARRTVGGRDGPLRTVDEVLAVMIESNEANLRTEERSRLQSMLRRGQTLEHAKKPHEALAVWEDVLVDITKMVAEDRKALEIETGRVKTAEKTAQSEGETDENATKISRLRNRLRVSVEVQHSAIFFIANAKFQIKTEETEGTDRFKELESEESARYEEAKILRRELLSSSAENARTFMDRIRMRAKTNKFVRVKGFKDISLSGGLETRKYVDQLADIFDCLNQQAELLDDWREKLAKAVLLPLIDQEDTELTGEEYEQSTKEEDQLHAYMEALRLLIADRAQVITGQRNLNVRREATRLFNDAVRGEGHAPDLMKALLRQVNQMRVAESREGEIEAWLRGTMQQLIHLRGTLDGRSGRSGEVAIIDKILLSIRPETEDAMKTVTALDKELELFSDTVNSRVEYYRQLQVISDLVAPLEKELSDNELVDQLARMQQEEEQYRSKAVRLRGRATFLQHLKVKSKSPAADAERICIICTDPFDNGVLTSCGHVYCKDCMIHWWNAHRTCPTCKEKLGKGDIQQITYKTPVIDQEAAEDNGQTRNKEHESKQQSNSGRSVYSDIDAVTLGQIRSIDLPRSYGTKIDMLARHIIWLRDKEPGAKSVVFSQFSEFFDILTEAFDRFHIGWSALSKVGPKAIAAEAGVERFKKDRDVEVLLLHAQSQAAGLNLVNATHVFLSEPLINTAIELQVIARVHRIGQHSPTTVWMYLIEDTVEKAIYDISVQRRLAHIQASPTKAKPNGKSVSQKTNGASKAAEASFEAGMDAANSREIGAPAEKMLVKGRTGGEQVAKEDLWPCLFTYRPRSQLAMSDAAQHTATAFLAGEAAESRRQDIALRSFNGAGS